MVHMALYFIMFAI